jgi:Zn-dependent peptidase ImmA (M78 family)
VAILNALINKETLRVICEAKRIEPSYIAEKIGCKPASKVDEWLKATSDILPTFNQAKKVAGCLHIPFAGLYMNPDDVPKHKLPKIVNRRTLPVGYSADESALNVAIADLLEARDLLITLKRELNEPVIPFTVSIDTNTSANKVAAEIRKCFDISLDEQFKKASQRQFYLYVRQQVEAKGVFVHCFTDVDVEMARGLAMFYDLMPVIGLNGNDRPPAKTFSIVHELVHLLRRQSSSCNEFINAFSSNAEEIFCNNVAGELLVPKDALFVKLSRHLRADFTIPDIQKLANDFSVSKEVIIRRLLDSGVINEVKYSAYSDELHRIIELEREERRIARAEGRPVNIPKYPSREAIDRTSTTLCSSLFRGYTEDVFSKQDVSRYLGISQKYADKFLEEVSRWYAR